MYMHIYVHTYVMFFQHSSRVAKCKVCFLAREVLQQNLTPESEKAVLKERDEHLKRQRYSSEFLKIIPCQV